MSTGVDSGSGPSLAAAAAEIAKRDPGLGRVIAAVGPPELRPPLESAFASLVRAITFQQLAGRAAASIHGRLVATLPDGVTPAGMMSLTEPEMRAAGLSRAKVASIRDLAARALDGTVPDDSVLAELDDEDVIARLSQVRGIGRWTAEMFLIFQLRRPDVWPVDDLGVRKGYAVAHGLAAPPAPRELQALGHVYRPYRTLAAWYCWRAVETVLPD